MEINEIKQQLTIGQVLDHYGLKPDRNKMLCCPFHDDKAPSMQVYAETNTVFCFSSNCKLHGKAIDVIDFVLYQEGITKHEAILKAQELLGHASNGKEQMPSAFADRVSPKALAVAQAPADRFEKLFKVFRGTSRKARVRERIYKTVTSV